MCVAATVFSRTQTWRWNPTNGQSVRHFRLPAASNHALFDWDTAVTSPDLDYASCYDGEFQCARLQLPMDYWNGTTNATISLAVVKKPAIVDITDPRYGGAVLLNPGGPGGSGVKFVVQTGHQIRATLDSKNGKLYDIISFDPRGVGDSSPSVRCFQNSEFAQSWAVRLLEEGSFEASDAALGRIWAMATAKGRSCSLPVQGPDIRKYMSTASVARDMLEIVERHGQWREREARRVLKHQKQPCGSHERSIAETLEAVRYKPGAEKIQYWGFSYGSYLGNTFAAMFPHRVERLVVDGVVNAYNYAQALWSDNLIDTEKVMDAFYVHCARAGYPACALANATSNTAAGVRQRVEDILAGLYYNPLPVIGTNPEVVTYSDVRTLIFAALYTPIKSFPRVAQRLVELEHGNGTEFAKSLSTHHSFVCGDPAYHNRTRSLGMSYDSEQAIACTDGDDQSWLNRTAFEAFSKELAAISPTIGSMWSMIRMHCVHYDVRPVYRFVGPWRARTSHPLLMIGNRADPVTPVQHAHRMAEGFEGAVVLTQDSAGHCSLSTFSNCTVQYVRTYFQTGELPPVNTTCLADELPFGPGQGEVETASAGILEERHRHAELTNGLVAAGGGFMRLGVARALNPHE